MRRWRVGAAGGLWHAWGAAGGVLVVREPCGHFCRASATQAAAGTPVVTCFPHQYALPDFAEGERCVPRHAVDMVRVRVRVRVTRTYPYP